MINEDASNLKELHSSIANLPEAISTNFTYHSFTPLSQLAITTMSGHILVLGSDGLIVKIIPPQVENLSLYSIVSSKKGIVVGGKGYLAVYSSTGKENDPYTFTSNAYLKDNKSSSSLGDLSMENETINCIDLSCFTNSTAALITSNHQLLKASISFTPSTPINIEYLICEFHSKGINGLDLCIKKPLAITCSREDKTVKIWNYIQMKLELTKTYQDDLINVAFHPSGFHVIIGMLDKIILANVLSNDLTQFNLIPLKVVEFSLSNGGHLLAVSDQVNVNKILVYNFYTGISIPYYEDKFKNSNKIKTIKWFDDDSGFSSTDGGGCAYEWKFSEVGNNTASPFQLRNYVFSSMVRVIEQNESNSIPISKLFVACGDKSIREVANDTLIKTHEIGMQCGQLTIMKNQKQKILFAGKTEAQKPGILKLLKFPLCGEGVELQVHSQEIEKIVVNSTNKYVLTCSKDGSLYVFEVRDRDKVKEIDELPILYSEEMLSNLEEQAKLEKTKADLIQQKLEAQSDTNKEQLQSQNEENIRLAQNELISITKENETKKNLLKESIEGESKKYENEKGIKMEKHATELEEIQNKFSKELINKNTEYSEETVKKEEKEKQMNKELAELTFKYDDEINKKKEEFLAEQSKKEEELKKKREALAYAEKQNYERQTQLQEDLKEEEDKVKKKNDENIKKVNDAIGKTKGDLQNSKKKIQENSQTKQEKERDLQDKDQEKKRKELENELLTKDKLGKEKEKKIKDEEIGKLEDQIYNLKKDTQELEKFKYVLDYKIKELKRDISPREKEIQKLKAQTNEMDQDLKDFNKYNSHLGLIVKTLELRLNARKNLMAQQRNNIRDNEVLIKRMKDAVYSAVQFIEDYEKLKEATGILMCFVKKKINTQQIESEIKKEYEEQKEYLVQSVNILKDQLYTHSEEHKKDNNKIRNENKELILEISRLREKLNRPKGENAEPAPKKSAIDMNDKLRENRKKISNQLEIVKKLQIDLDSLTK